MATQEIPLTPSNQKFDIAISGVSYSFRIIWRESFWALDISDRTGTLLVGGIPLVTGADLLEQYDYLGFGFGLRIVSDDPSQPSPTKTNLGTTAHLYVVT